jgi:hypothetical protein
MSSPDSAAGSSHHPRGNPAPRRALSRFSPRVADEGAAPSAAAAAPVPVERGAHGEPSPAAAPGGTGGRDLLIPGPGPAVGRGKNGRPVPSLADLMPPPEPAGHRSGGQRGHQRGHGGRTSGADAAAGKQSSVKAGGKDAKTVEIAVRLPKPVRKRLKARASELGLTPEQAVARLVEVWLEE